jgi:hypothetical protein
MQSLIRMSLALVAFVLMGAGAQVLQSQALARYPPDPWIGCYELRIAENDEWKQVHGAIPHRFQLLSSPRNFGSFEAQTLEKRTDWFVLWARYSDDDAWLSEDFRKASWWPDSQGALNVGFETRLVHYVVNIRRSESGLTGTAQPFVRSMNGVFQQLDAINVGLKPIACASFEHAAAAR